MRFADILNKIPSDCTVQRECDFDGVYLVGKQFDASRRMISFVGNIQYINSFLGYNLAGVICTDEVAKELEGQYDGGILIADDPKTAFFEIHNAIDTRHDYPATTIGQGCIIHETAVIAKTGVSIGDNTLIGPYAVIHENTTIGAGCTIRDHVVIGTPAFYYYGSGDQRFLVESTGGVLIGSNVELHPHCKVEKGVIYGNTVIGNNTKIDNGILIGHDSQIGKDCTLAGCTTLAGGVTLKDNVFVGVGAVFAPNVIVEEHATISSGAVVTKLVPEGTQASGNFAISHDKFIQFIKSISK
jgi:UDP-3-O-[3-hydroxymyristoyl] glucosamine N-acyltransferase